MQTITSENGEQKSAVQRDGEGEFVPLVILKHQSNVTDIDCESTRLRTFFGRRVGCGGCSAKSLRYEKPDYSTAIGIWLVLGRWCLYALYIQGLGVAGVWLSIASDLLIRAVFLLYRFVRMFRDKPTGQAVSHAEQNAANHKQPLPH
ncbi:hypothetical protein [Paenibacillus sanguinis]|uniref:hypothetical protein n=1 Tax=Paenibacillus sanguinis TaxID=225906 RepID=UPI0003A80389|nr:hypothetical protein [Paenibacillus sanguinis]